jgi:hypothetical protein
MIILLHTLQKITTLTMTVKITGQTAEVTRNGRTPPNVLKLTKLMTMNS